MKLPDIVITCVLVLLGSLALMFTVALLLCL